MILNRNVKFEFPDFRFFNYWPIFTSHNIFLSEHALNFSVLLHWELPLDERYSTYVFQSFKAT